LRRVLAGILLLALPMAWAGVVKAETSSPELSEEKLELKGQPAPVKGRTLGSDVRKAVWRVPTVMKGQFLSWEGLRIFVYGAPFLAASFIEERAVSDWCRENRIPEDSGLDAFLDVMGGVIYPIAFLPTYALARSIGNDRMADLAVDLTTFTLVSYPELIALRYIGDRPRPDGTRDFIFGLEACSSFPSGHTLAAVGAARLAHYYYGYWVGIPLYLLAAAIGYQRLGEGRHYLADVVGGAILGFSAADAIVRDRRREKEGVESEKKLSVLPMVGGRYRAVGVAVSWDF
jgi:membrane-associated phospholipid phosphatase